MNSYGTVKTLKMLHALQNHTEGEILFCEENNHMYTWRNDRWEVVQSENKGLSMSLYDLNKNVVNQLKPLTKEQMAEKKALIKAYHEKKKNNFYMLLCQDYNYYTVFKKSGDVLPAHSFENTVEEIILPIGEVYSIENTTDKEAVEIWIKPHTMDDPCVFYLFGYDLGVVEYGK